jgi:hypothetical protein
MAVAQIYVLKSEDGDAATLAMATPTTSRVSAVCRKRLIDH